MYHKISDMCKKCELIFEKSQKLKDLKYNTEYKSRDTDIEIDVLVSDIQSLCRDIANDTGKYQKLK